MENEGASHKIWTFLTEPGRRKQSFCIIAVTVALAIITVLIVINHLPKNCTAEDINWVTVDPTVLHPTPATDARYRRSSSDYDWKHMDNDLATAIQSALCATITKEDHRKTKDDVRALVSLCQLKLKQLKKTKPRRPRSLNLLHKFRPASKPMEDPNHPSKSTETDSLLEPGNSSESSVDTPDTVETIEELGQPEPTADFSFLPRPDVVPNVPDVLIHYDAYYRDFHAPDPEIDTNRAILYLRTLLAEGPPPTPPLYQNLPILTRQEYEYLNQAQRLCDEAVEAANAKRSAQLDPSRESLFSSAQYDSLQEHFTPSEFQHFRHICTEMERQHLGLPSLQQEPEIDPPGHDPTGHTPEAHTMEPPASSTFYTAAAARKLLTVEATTEDSYDQTTATPPEWNADDYDTEVLTDTPSFLTTAGKIVQFVAIGIFTFLNMIFGGFFRFLGF